MFSLISILLALTLVNSTKHLSASDTLNSKESLVIKYRGSSYLKSIAWGTEDTQLYILPDTCLNVKEMDQYKPKKITIESKVLEDGYLNCWNIGSVSFNAGPKGFPIIAESLNVNQFLAINKYVVVYNPSNISNTINLEVRIQDNYMTWSASVTYNNVIAISAIFMFITVSAVAGVCGCGWIALI